VAKKTATRKTVARKRPVAKKTVARKTVARKKPVARKAIPANPVHRQIEMLRKQLVREFEKLHKELKKTSTKKPAARKTPAKKDRRPQGSCASQDGSPDNAPRCVNPTYRPGAGTKNGGLRVAVFYCPRHSCPWSEASDTLAANRSGQSGEGRSWIPVSRR
jgi:hypothetical protein